VTKEHCPDNIMENIVINLDSEGDSAESSGNNAPLLDITQLSNDWSFLGGASNCISCAIILHAFKMLAIDELSLWYPCEGWYYTVSTMFHIEWLSSHRGMTRSYFFFMFSI
jgi:hypothetical protein